MRDTYVEVNLNNIKYNVKEIIKKYNNYKYYFGVVKADCYGHGIKVVNSMIAAGINYLAVATLEEALEVRMINKDIPILCFGVIANDDLIIAKENDITVTIPSLDYLNNIDINNLKKVHIKINSGMNRLGISSKEEFDLVYSKLKNVDVEGIYSHIYSAFDSDSTIKQFAKFEEIVSSIDLSKIKIVHIPASETIIKYPKRDYINGCRLGIIMYGFLSNLKSTFTLHSKVIAIHDLKKGATVGYNACFKANSDTKIAVIAIGYADGIIRANTGRYVYINNKKYKIVGNICMDMLFVEIDDNVKLYDDVLVIKDNEHLNDIAAHLNTIVYEVMCEIGKRVPRKYVD